MLKARPLRLQEVHPLGALQVAPPGPVKPPTPVAWSETTMRRVSGFRSTKAVRSSRTSSAASTSQRVAPASFKWLAWSIRPAST